MYKGQRVITICVCNAADSVADEAALIQKLRESGISAQPGRCFVNGLGGVSCDDHCPASDEEWTAEEWTAVEMAKNAIPR